MMTTTDGAAAEGRKRFDVADRGLLVFGHLLLLLLRCWRCLVAIYPERMITNY